MRTSLRRLGAAAVLAAGMPLALLAGIAPAHAAVAPGVKACDKASCNGLDPTLTYRPGSNPRAYCNAGAKTVASERVYGGLLELRQGPNCGTQWVRFTPSNNDTYFIYLYSSSLPGHYVGSGLDSIYLFAGKEGVVYYSDQLYSPGVTQYCVGDDTTGGRGESFPCFPYPESQGKA